MAVHQAPCPWDSPGKNTGVGAISFSNAWKWKVKVKSLSRIQLLATPWTAAYQAPPSMGFSRQEYWSGVPLSSPQSNRAVSFKFLHHYCFSKEQRNTFLNFLIKIYYNKYISSLCVCIYIHTHTHATIICLWTVILWRIINQCNI